MRIARAAAAAVVLALLGLLVWDVTHSGKGGVEYWVVRIKPTAYTMFPDDLFEQQYRIIEALHAQGNVRVARPLGFEPDPSVLGAPFLAQKLLTARAHLRIVTVGGRAWTAELNASGLPPGLAPGPRAHRSFVPSARWDRRRLRDARFGVWRAERRAEGAR